MILSDSLYKTLETLLKESIVMSMICTEFDKPKFLQSFTLPSYSIIWAGTVPCENSL